MKSEREVNSYRNLWQNPIWEKFQKNIGRKTWQLSIKGASALVIKHMIRNQWCWLEVPRGPLFESEKALNEILEKITEIGKKEGAIFIRFSPYQKCEVSDIRCQTSKSDHHPETTLVLDLNQSEQELLAQMKPKGRYNIKIAHKHDVTVSKSDDVKSFHNILKLTGNRDGFGIHPLRYYEKFLESLGGNAELLMAYYQDKPIAGGLFVYLENWCIYYYGASDHRYRKVMAPYLVQWTAVKNAKQKGCKYYDFLGISSTNDPYHNWAGVTQFKKKFGGEVVHYPQAQEIIIRPFLYRLYKFYKRIKY